MYSRSDVFPQRFGAYGSIPIEELLDLPEDEGVPFQCSGVMGLLMPDVRPHSGGLIRGRQAAQTVMEFSDGGVEACVGCRPGGPPAWHGGSSDHLDP